MDTKRKKSLIAFILCAVLTIVFAAAAGVLLSIAPRNEVIASADGSTVTRVARSYIDDSWYYGDSAGNLVKMSADGREVCPFRRFRPRARLPDRTRRGLQPLYRIRRRRKTDGNVRARLFGRVSVACRRRRIRLFRRSRLALHPVREVR